MAQVEPIRDKKQLRHLARYWFKRSNYRNYTMIVLGVHTALRIGDLLSLSWDDVYDEELGEFRSHITLIERKTGKEKVIALSDQALKALRLYYPYRKGKFIFASNRKCEKAISRVQAWRIVHTAVKAIGIGGKIACHSLRKTFGYHAWIKGISPVIIMDIYNHSNYEVTRRYLGVSQDDRDKVYLGMDLF